MSIDWEWLLDSEGEDLQDAYDALCDWDDDPWLADIRDANEALYDERAALYDDLWLTDIREEE